MLGIIKSLHKKYCTREEYGFVLCATILSFFICDLIIMNLKYMYYNGLIFSYSSGYTRHVDLLLKFVVVPLGLASILCSKKVLMSAIKRGLVASLFLEGAYSLASNVRKFIVFKANLLETIFSSECILSTAQMGVFLFLLLFLAHRYLNVNMQPMMFLGSAMVFVMQCYFLIQRNLGNIYFIPGRFVTLAFLTILAVALWVDMQRE